MNDKIKSHQVQPGCDEHNKLIITLRNNLLTGINDPINGLNSLIGRDDIKNMIAVQIISFSNNPMTFLNKFNNFALYGPSGIGKTKIGRTLAWFYAKSGILVKDLFAVVTSSKIVSSFIGKTPQIMNKLLESTLDGVLFIDEAYSLVKSTKERNTGYAGHGVEAIDELVGFIDKNVGMCIIIIAGYQDRMENDFMTVNEGLTRRFPNVIILTPYNSAQLADLLLIFLAQSYGPEISLIEGDLIFTYIDFLYTMEPPIFSNQAGDILLLSGYMLEAIYGSKNIWVPGGNNHKIIFDGFNTYLSKKNKKITLTAHQSF